MKQQQRKLLKQRRNALSKEEVQYKSNLICEKLKPYLQGVCALYCAYGKEVQLDTLFSTCRCALPVVDNDTDMHFVYYENHQNYQEGAFQIREPKDGILCNKEDIQVIVVPLVGFDKELHRMGHGKGYYDRYLENIDALKIGVAYENQKLEHIVTEAYDISLDMIITEENIYQKHGNE